VTVTATAALLMTARLGPTAAERKSALRQVKFDGDLEAVVPVDKSGRVRLVGSVPVLHPEAQTVYEMLEGWRSQQLCRKRGS
jgi:hypothetical protein